MVNKKIVFFKTLKIENKSTEIMALDVLNDPKYDDFPQYIDKEEIQKAFDEYGYVLNPSNTDTYTNIMNSPNIEGHFMSQNIPEIDSIVIDQVCNEKIVHDVLDKDDEITHVGLSTYAMGIGNTMRLVKIIQKNYPAKEIYIGGIGSLYPHLYKLVKKENICTGNGVNWLRRKFGLSPLRGSDFKIPTILGQLQTFLIPINTAYLVSQIGCPYNCDFCITSKLLQYNPFCQDERKIIQYIEDARALYDDDILLFMCDPNALFPERVWKKVFDYFIENNRSDKIVYIFGLISLSHLKSFNIEKIQNYSALKFFMINFGIESTLKGGYIKNKGVTNDYINKLNNLGIITFHNFILGLPHHNERTINLEIKNNLDYDSVWFSINTLKPLPSTPIYEQLKRENRLFGEDLPSEFLYREGFFPFEHKYLGRGFAALKYAFKAYYECEKKVLDVYSSFAETISKLPIAHSSNFSKNVIKTFLDISEKNFSLFKPRMTANLIENYELKLHKIHSSLK